MKKFFKRMYAKFIAALGLLCRLLPINKKRIYLISNDGEKYSCNPRAIFEYLYKNHKDEFDFVYIVNNNHLKSLLPKDVKTAKQGTLKEYFYY
ncbi:MAG: CDP-glycerol glycerophosphotransferase family protein [Clostridia bacterium]|nr:CDP-glycerol glycerophosphotransferase family protein [Clostridia bacterium]